MFEERGGLEKERILGKLDVLRVRRAEVIGHVLGIIEGALITQSGVR